jgi:zinc/manganese transport system permease protein
MSLSGLDVSILLPALTAGLLVLSTHVPLGRQVLARGIIFIDLAVAQIAGLGVMLWHMLGWGANPWLLQGLAVASALAGAMGLSWCERRWPEIQEALIGVVFVLAASGGLLLLAGHPKGGEHLHDLLAGQILWVSWEQIGWTLGLYLPMLGAWWFWPWLRQGLGFYFLFAIAVTASVQLVGVYLVFASLILPALASRKCGARVGLVRAFTVGLVGYSAGLLLSALLDLPSGPMIVWALAAAAVLGSGSNGRKSSEREQRGTGFQRL